MPLFSVLPFVAAGASVLLAVASVVRKKPSNATWCFFAGMLLLATAAACTGLGLRAGDPQAALRWLVAASAVKSFLPAAWLPFSLTYSRGNYRESVARWAIPLSILALLPIGLAVAFRQGLLQLVPIGSDGETLAVRTGAAGTALNIILLVTFVLVLANLEQTFRSAVGTMRWRIKFVVLGLGVIFGAHLYASSQALLFSVQDLGLSGIESSGLLIGCLFLAIAYARTGLAEIDVYPSRTVLRSSFTVLIAGGYLFVVGVLAQVATRFGGAESFQFQALVVLLGMAGLGVLLLSDRLRQRIHDFVGRHFGKAQHDSVRTWSEFSRRLANVKDQAALSAVSARLVSETFQALSVTVWLLNEQQDQLTLAATTAPHTSEWASPSPSPLAPGAAVAGLEVKALPFNLEAVDEPWAAMLRQRNPTAFPNGGDRWCAPLRAGDQCLGVVVLADRVNGAGYTLEELELLRCIGDQVASVLVNVRLANEVARARELEAFRTMSAFFVHDLKNAAASLNLMLKNLPVHFDDPAFREDALRGIGNTAARIDGMIGKLSALRQRPDGQRVEADLNRLVSEAIEGLDGMPGVELTKDLVPVPPILADPERIQSVVTNLLVNARDALAPGGRIQVRTEHCGGRVLLSVADDGCGMSEAFVRESLFRPFRSTKKKGLGIGMFQSRAIVDDHRGSIQVESEAGRGTTVRVSLPVKDER